MRLIETKGDLFTSEDSLAHCVSADFRMSAGIAVEFRDRFGHQAALRSEGWAVGSVARKRVHQRFVFYMVTKPLYYQKPTYTSLRQTLVQLARWVELLKIRTLAIPPISCVRDKLDWSIVKGMIKSVFDGLDVTITVYFL